MLARRLCQRGLHVTRSRVKNRRFSSDVKATEAKTVDVKSSVADTASVDATATQSRPGFFSRHPEIFFLAGLFGIGGYIYRSSVNNKKFNEIQNNIAESSPISPFEAYELRSQNEITPDVFEAVKKQAKRFFPSNEATVADFDLCLGSVLQGTMMKNTHHLERVLLSLPKNENKKVDVDLLLVAFSLAVKGDVDERLKCLFQLPLAGPATPSTTLTKKDISKVLGHVLETYQIPSEKRVVALEDKTYPYQEYDIASADQMVDAAFIAAVKSKSLEEAESYDLEQFSLLMKSKAICIWGECYNSSSKKRMKN